VLKFSALSQSSETIAVDEKYCRVPINWSINRYEPMVGMLVGRLLEWSEFDSGTLEVDAKTNEITALPSSSRP